MKQRLLLTILSALLLILVGSRAAAPTWGQGGLLREKEVQDALRKAGRFFYEDVAAHGGYVWSYSGDLQLREGEATTDETMIWVQPPATPTVGEIFLRAHQATGESMYLDAARDAATALVRGQLRSGGWFYSIEFDPDKRLRYAYVDGPIRRNQRMKSTLDDDVTQSVLRFLMRFDEFLEFKDEQIHAAVQRGLESLLRVQYRNGAWYQWWDDPDSPRDGNDFPVTAASYPDAWPRVWPNTWTGRYFLNDNVMADVIDTMLLAYDIYNDDRYLTSATKAGDFLLLAQMPAPQPAWAQQYDPGMHPVWDRKFEPPAISGGESQGVMRTLLKLYRRTGKREYLDAVPTALEYLRKSTLPNGKLARFYELQTNRPLYFKVTGKRYDLTYDSKDSPSHYAFQVPSSLDRIEAEYRQLASTPATELPFRQESQPARKRSRQQSDRLRSIIDSMDHRGAWIEDGVLDAHDVRPESGVIHSRSFVKNVSAMIDYLNAAR
jgi:PelA/Pel-15E family pectate lyase